MLSYPPRELWPEKVYSLPELSYAETLNACHDLLDLNLAEGRASSPAIYFNNSVITYRELLDDVMRIAGSLRQRGIQPGDCVILRLLNRPHFISAFLALLRMGAVPVPTPPLIRARELSAIIESSDPALLIAETELWTELDKLEANSVRLANIESLRDSAPYRECAATPKDSPAVLLYTSGSTGVPKGCIHSHSDLLAICDSHARYILQPTPADRFGGHPTMAFAYGLGGLLAFPLRFGASTVLLDRFTPEAMVETIRSARVSIAFCAPISLRLMMRQNAGLRDAVSSLRLAVSAGETLPAPVYRAWREGTSAGASPRLRGVEALGRG